MSTLSTMKQIKTIGIWIAGFVILAFVATGLYRNCEAFFMIGQKVTIDGKTLTITSAEGTTLILSDRTRIQLFYAEELIEQQKGKR